MPNEIVIIVRAKNDTKQVFDAIRRDARHLGDDMGNDVTVTFTERIKRDAGQASGAYARAGDSIGDTIGERVTQRINERISRDVGGRLRDSRGRFVSGDRTTINNNTSNRDRTSISNSDSGGSDRDREHVTVHVDVDKQSLLQRMGSAAKEAGSRFTGVFGGALSTFFSGDFISMIVKAVAVGGLATALAGVLGAAVSSAILVALGGGVIAIGVAAALRDPIIAGEVGKLKTKIGGIFSDFGSYFKGPVVDFLGMFSGLLDSMAPAIDQLGKSFGPIADDLAHGVIGFLQNALPGIMRGMEASKPLIKTLSDELPGIGDAIGKFFDHISASAPDANKFFNDLLNALPHIIEWTGTLIEALGTVYGVTRTVFLDMVLVAATWAEGITAAASIAFGWVPGLGPKLDRAARKAKEFKDKVNREIKGIHNDTTIQVKVKTFGMDMAIRLRNIIAQLNAMRVTTVAANAAGVINEISASLRASGGITGAASGGIRRGLTWVGEHGPELVNVPAGSRVYSNPDSMRMVAGQGGGAGPLVVQLVLDGYVLAERMLDPQREIVSRRFAGNVQAAWGR